MISVSPGTRINLGLNGGGLYRQGASGGLVEASSYNNGVATFGSRGSGTSAFSASTGGSTGSQTNVPQGPYGTFTNGRAQMTYNGVYSDIPIGDQVRRAAQKGGKSMGKKKQVLSGEPLGKEYLDAVSASDETNRKARDTRIKKNSENRRRNLERERAVLDAEGEADAKAYQSYNNLSIGHRREMLEAREEGDGTKFAGKHTGKAMKGFLAGRAKMLEQGKAGAAQAIANAEARLRQGQKDYARYSKNVERDREERDSKNHSEAGSYKAYTDYVAAVKAGGGKPSSFRSWQIQDRVAREKERSINASNNIWNKTLAERKIARSQERIAAAQQAQEGYTADIARLHDLGKTLKDYDEASAADVARQLQARDLTGMVEYAGVRQSADVMREAKTAKAAMLAGRSRRKGGYRR